MLGEVALADRPGLAVGLLDLRLLPGEVAEAFAFRGSLNREFDMRVMASSSLEELAVPLARPRYLRFLASRLRVFFLPIPELFSPKSDPNFKKGKSHT